MEQFKFHLHYLYKYKAELKITVIQYLVDSFNLKGCTLVYFFMHIVLAEYFTDFVFLHVEILRLKFRDFELIPDLRFRFPVLITRLSSNIAQSSAKCKIMRACPGRMYEAICYEILLTNISMYYTLSRFIASFSFMDISCKLEF